MWQQSAQMTIEHETLNSGTFEDDPLSLSQRDWVELIEYPYRTLKEVEAAMAEAKERFAQYMKLGKVFCDSANLILLGQIPKRFTKIDDPSVCPFYIAHSYDRSYTLLKWRSHRHGADGELLNNRKRTVLTEEMIQASPEPLREKMIQIERRRIELNYVAALDFVKRQRLLTALEQIQNANRLKREL
jgi:hypothetical protein